MATISIVNTKGEEVGLHELPDSVFKIEPNKSVLHFVVVSHLANCRQGTQSTLTRAEVSGGGKKPWRQKGTGHARQGSIRAPQWTHGGIVHGPKPRKYGFSVNKKVKKLAMKSAFSDKFLESNLVLVDKIELETYKTKAFIEILKNLKLEGKSLFVLGRYDKKVVKSAANIDKIKTLNVNELNVYDILNHGKLVLEVEALKKIEEVYV